MHRLTSVVPLLAAFALTAVPSGALLAQYVVMPSSPRGAPPAAIALNRTSAAPAPAVLPAYRVTPAAAPARVINAPAQSIGAVRPGVTNFAVVNPPSNTRPLAFAAAPLQRRSRDGRDGDRDGRDRNRDGRDGRDRHDRYHCRIRVEFEEPGRGRPRTTTRHFHAEASDCRRCYDRARDMARREAGRRWRIRDVDHLGCRPVRDRRRPR